MLRTILLLCTLPAAAVLAWLSLSPGAKRADLVVASDPIRSLDPHRVSWADEIQLVGAIFEGLTRVSPHGGPPEPGVAERWDVSPDGRLYTFHLRADARWSNGEPVTARDFRWAWLRALDPASEAPYAGLLFVIEGAEARYRALASRRMPEVEPAAVAVEALDERTLRVRLRAPCAYFLELLAMPVFAPVYPPLLEKLAYREGRVLAATRHLWTRPENIVCNGPFLPADWLFKQRVLLRRNPRYWDVSNIALGSIEVLFVGGNTALVAYETGRVDFVRGLDLDAARGLKVASDAGRRRDFQVSDRFATFFLRVNCRRSPLAENPDLRKALSLAIDREELCAHVLAMGESPAYTLVPRNAAARMQWQRNGATVGYEPPAGLGAGLPRDERLALAREHLRRSGFTPETLRPIELACTAEPVPLRRACEAVQAMWERNLGIRVTLAVLGATELNERIQKLDYDVVRGNWFGDYFDPSTFLDLFVAGGGRNLTGWGDPRYDEAIAAAAVEGDIRKRLAVLREAERILCEEALPIIPLFTMRGTALLRERFSGVTLDMQVVAPVHRLRVKS